MFDTLQKVKTKNLGSHQKDRKDRFQNNKRQETFFAICDAGYSGEKKSFFASHSAKIFLVKNVQPVLQQRSRVNLEAKRSKHLLEYIQM